MNDIPDGTKCVYGGTLTYREDEYNGLSGGGDYEIYDCTCSKGKHYVMLPD